MIAGTPCTDRTRYGVPRTRTHGLARLFWIAKISMRSALAVGPQLNYEIGLAAIANGLPRLHGEAACAHGIAGAGIGGCRRARAPPSWSGFMKRYSTANRIAANVIHSPEFGPPRELSRPVHDGADLFRARS